MTRPAPTPQRVTTIPPIDPDDQGFRDGLSDAAGTLLDPEELYWLDDEHPAVPAWQLLREEIVAEVAPEVARLIDEAVQRRLPWAWESER